MTKITSLSALRANRNSFEKITKDIESLTKKKEYAQDERMWQCATDDAKNGSAIIRFLPAIVDDNKPYVRMYTHNFKGPGGYYIENCLTTIEKEDPCCISNDALWKTGIKENQELVSGINGKNARKRKLSYYANVYIVSDPANPENVGKVKIFKFGAKIMEKLLAALKPEFEGSRASWTGSAAGRPSSAVGISWTAGARSGVAGAVRPPWAGLARSGNPLRKVLPGAAAHGGAGGGAVAVGRGACDAGGSVAGDGYDW